MSDNYDEYNEYDDLRSDDNNPDQYQLIIFKGTYCIRLINDMQASNGNSEASFIVEPTGVDIKGMPTIFEVFESFDNTFLLEFLVTLLADGMLVIGSLKKLIQFDSNNNPAIYVTAKFSSEQKYLAVDDIVESDESATDMLMVGNTSVMRTHQYFYSTTQAVKWCVVKYDAYKDKNFSWYREELDWSLIYQDLVEPYIKIIIANALKTHIDTVHQYNDYIKFGVHYYISRLGSSFYMEIFALPLSVFHHKLIYSVDNGRQILLSILPDNMEEPDKYNLSSDLFRVCMGSQNLNFCPINCYHLRRTTDNGNMYVVVNEVPEPDDELINRFILGPAQYSTLPTEICVYLQYIPGFEPCPLDIKLSDGTTVQSMFTYFGFSQVPTEQIAAMNTSTNTMVLGTCSFSFAKDLKPDELVSTIYDFSEIPNGNNILPSKFYENLTKKYNNPYGSDYALIPIRALPKYREFMVLVKVPESKMPQSQSDIINANKENKPVKKSGLLKALFG